MRAASPALALGTGAMVAMNFWGTLSGPTCAPGKERMRVHLNPGLDQLPGSWTSVLQAWPTGRVKGYY